MIFKIADRSATENSAKDKDVLEVVLEDADLVDALKSWGYRHHPEWNGKAWDVYIEGFAGRPRVVLREKPAKLVGGLCQHEH